MNPINIELLHNLISIPSPSGYEENIAHYIHDHLAEIVGMGNIEVDSHNNVTVKIKGKTDKTVMFCSHQDEIAFLITNINRFGQISLMEIGGTDATLLSARHLHILTSEGIVNAVVDRKHVHLIRDVDDENIYDPSTAHVDIGTKDRNQIIKKISVGDPVIFKPELIQLSNNYYAGYGFDDKSGCYILIEAIKSIVSKKYKPEMNLVFVFSSQEEVESSNKLAQVVRKHKPNLLVDLDVCFATDYGEIDDMENEVGRCNLGDGCVLFRGVDVNENCVQSLISILKRKKIKYQIQAHPGDANFHGLMVNGEADNIKSLPIGIPIRNMHSPVEVLDTDDLINGQKIINALVYSKTFPKILE